MKIPRTVLRVGYVLLLLIAISTASITELINRDLKRALSSYQNMHLLSPDTCKVISADLNSSDPARIAAWKLYFQRVAAGRSDVQDGGLPARDVVDIYYNQYKTTEHPGRSNHFYQLLSALVLEQDFNGLTVRNLFGYLGEPDALSNAGGHRFLQYKFSIPGTNGFVSIEAAGDTVVGFDFAFWAAQR